MDQQEPTLQEHPKHKRNWFARRSLRLKIAGAIIATGLLVLAALPPLFFVIGQLAESSRVQSLEKSTRGIFRNLVAGGHQQNQLYLRAWIGDNKGEFLEDDELNQEVMEEKIADHAEEFRKNLGSGYLLVYDSDADLQVRMSIVEGEAEMPSVEELDPVQQAVFQAIEDDSVYGAVFKWQGYGIYRVDVVPVFDSDQIISHLMVAITDLSALLRQLNEAAGVESLLVLEDTQVGGFQSLSEWSTEQTMYPVIMEEQNRILQLMHINIEDQKFEGAVLHFLSDATDWTVGMDSIRETSLIIALAALMLLGVMGFLMAESIARAINRIMETILATVETMNDQMQRLDDASQQIVDSSTAQEKAVTDTQTVLGEVLTISQSAMDVTDSGAHELAETTQATGMGSQSAQEMDQQIGQIRTATDRLRDIIAFVENVEEKISEIDAIVFQTKILSFNASIEASRAGEAGRGFSVVAESVGTLAQHCGKVADEINAIIKEGGANVIEIIEQTQSSIEQGEAAHRQSAQNFTSIEQNVTKLGTGFEKIRTSMQSQGSEIHTLKQTLQSLADTTTSNMQQTDALSQCSDDLSLANEEIAKEIHHLQHFLTGS